VPNNQRRLIIFDLDGVLIDTKPLHYAALNEALADVSSKFIISWEDHIKVYDGLNTREKLRLLTLNSGLPENKHDFVWLRKQEHTIDAFGNIVPSERLIALMKTLREKGFLLACCTNSIRRSAYVVLARLGVIEYLDLIVSNQDVPRGKPCPDMFWNAMVTMNVLPENTLILEDSPPGLIAANTSGANVLQIRNPTDVTVERITSAFAGEKAPNIQWKESTMNVLIPMAGAGSRFAQAGYKSPKPLIDVEGKPMILRVVENLNIHARYIFVVQAEHREKYQLDTLLNTVVPGCVIIETDGLTEGAACTTLLAKDYIDGDEKLIIANSDQIMDWSSLQFLYAMSERNADGGIITHTATHPKWSFAKVNEFGNITEVAEKKPISDMATVGVYYWAHGRDYVKYVEQMMEKNIRTNGEFYVCPAYNEAIADGKIIRPYHVHKMWGIGTPEDLQIYLGRGNT